METPLPVDPIAFATTCLKAEDSESDDDEILDVFVKNTFLHFQPAAMPLGPLRHTKLEESSPAVRHPATAQLVRYYSSDCLDRLEVSSPVVPRLVASDGPATATYSSVARLAWQVLWPSLLLARPGLKVSSPQMSSPQMPQWIVSLFAVHRAEVKTPAEAVAKARSTRRRHHSPPCSSSEDSSASVPKSTGAAPSTTATTMSGPPTVGGKPAGPPPPTPVNAWASCAATSFRVGYGKCSASHDGLTNDGTDGLAYSAELFCRAPLDHSSSDTYCWTTEGTSWSSTGHTHCTHAAAQCTILHCGYG
eukprot:s4855_g2.t1